MKTIVAYCFHSFQSFILTNCIFFHNEPLFFLPLFFFFFCEKLLQESGPRYVLTNMAFFI